MLINDNLYLSLDYIFNLEFVSFYYLLFLGLTFICTFSFKGVYKALILIVMNFIYIYSYSAYNLIFILIYALIVYLISVNLKNKPYYNILFLIIGYMVILFFKYYSLLKIDNIFVPIGLSFIILRSIAYLIDIVNNKTKVSKNFIYFLAYISYFPVLIHGPLLKADTFFKNLSTKRFSYINRKSGFFQVVLGMIQIFVVYDYLNYITTNIFNNKYLFGLNILLGIYLFSIQVYIYFDALSNIAIGSSRLIGIDIKKNFNSPYLAGNIIDFWDRWFISLTSFFKDYIYREISKGFNNKIIVYLLIPFTFLLGTIWLIPQPNYLIFGLLHGLFYLIYYYFYKIRKSCKFPYFIGVIITFTLVSFIWLLIRFDNIASIIDLINRIFIPEFLNIDQIGLKVNEIIWLIILIGIIFIIDILRTKYDMLNMFNNFNFIIRWIVYFILIIVVIVFGVYGEIYEGVIYVIPRF